VQFDPLDLNSDEYERARKENEQAARDLDSLIHRVFAQSEDGKKLLGHLRRQMVQQQYGAHLNDAQLRYRTARADLVLEIEAAIERAESGA